MCTGMEVAVKPLQQLVEELERTERERDRNWAAKQITMNEGVLKKYTWRYPVLFFIFGIFDQVLI